MGGTISDAPAVALSCTLRLHEDEIIQLFHANADVTVANNFWGKDDAGVPPLLERMHNAKTTCDELRAFYSGETALTA